MGSISYVEATQQYLLTFVCISPQAGRPNEPPRVNRTYQAVGGHTVATGIAVLPYHILYTQADCLAAEPKALSLAEYFESRR